MIAAALAKTSGNQHSLVDQAMQLWKLAHSRIQGDRALSEEEAKQAAVAPEIPRPKKFPVTLDKFLRLMLPKKRGRTGDKYSVYRAFLARVAPLNTEERFARDQSEAMHEDEYMKRAKRFLRWYPEYLTGQHQKGGRARHMKSQSEK